METTENSSKFHGNTKAMPTQPTAHLDYAKMQGDSFLHFNMKELVWRNILIPPSGQLQRINFQGVLLMKQDILEVYSDFYTGIGKFPGAPY